MCLKDSNSACGGDETAISFPRTYLAHIEDETLDTLNAEYHKLGDKSNCFLPILFMFAKPK
ncbi:hypothetical protein FJZ31_35225 [Candidatus Poribacteria bacterium]|nr:hypothetical protein [Candidatus Poribacteria bacterium]